MVPLIIGMLICVALAVAVVAVVAIPARREGRELLSPQGEELMAVVKEKTESTLEKTGDALASAKDKVSDTVSSGSTPEPTREPAEETGRHRAAS
jgi:N-dimethylarginine dimethylaminohydrolase